MDGPDDVVIDAAWAESFSLDVDVEQTLRAVVGDATAETVVVDDDPATALTAAIDDDPATALTAPMSGPTVKTAVDADATVVEERGATGQSSSRRPTTRLIARSDEAPGDAHDYHLAGEVGIGGMGVVYAAEQRSLGRTVALKRQRPDRAGDPAMAERFVAEATVTGLLEHPSIVPVYELGTDVEGSPFYTMKLVQGQSWDQVIDTQSLEAQLETWQRVADGIAFAHSRGLVHCDLKPANVMLGRHGEVLVVDWGLAMRREAGARFATPIAAGATVGGTPAYMPPELARLDRLAIGPATDIYLLGAMLFRLLTGHPPHGGDSLRSCMRHAAKNVIRTVTVDAELAGLLSIAMQAMEADPAARFADVQAMQAALRVAREQRDGALLVLRATELAGPDADHAACDRALEALAEARRLAPALPGLDDEESAIRCRYAALAQRSGDHRLAMAVLRDDVPAEHAAYREAAAAVALAARRRRILQTTKRWAVVAGLVVAVVLIVSIFSIQSARQQAQAAGVAASAAREVNKAQAMRAALSRAATAQRQHDYASVQAALATVDPDFRDWVWRLLDHLTAGEDRVMPLPGRRPRGVAWLPDGSQLVVADLHGGIDVIDALTLRVVERWDSDIDGVKSCDVSPDGQRLLVVGSEAAAVINLADAQSVLRLDHDQVRGRWLDDEHVALFGNKTGLRLHALTSGSDTTWDLAGVVQTVVMRDHQVLVGMNGVLLQLDPADMASRIDVATVPGETVTGIELDGQALTFFTQQLTSLGMHVRTRRVADDGFVESVLRGEQPQSVQACADGFVFSVPRDRAVYVQQAVTGGLRQMLFPAAIDALAVHPDGRMIACARADGLHVAEPPDRFPLAQDALPTHQAAVRLAGDALYTLDIRGGIYRRDPRDGSELACLQEPIRLWTASTGSSDLDVLPGGELLVATGSAVQVHGSDGRLIQELASGGRRNRASLAASGDIAAVAHGNSLTLWEVPACREIIGIKPFGQSLTAVRWSPDDALLAMTAGHRIAVMRAADQQMVWEQRSPWDIKALAVSERGVIVAMADRIRVLDWADGSTLADLHGHQADVTCLAVNDARGRLFSGDNEGWLLCWDLDGWQQRLGIKVASHQLFCIDSVGDRVVHAGHDWMLHCWDLAAEVGDER